MQSITPFLWFDGKAEEAARFYLSVFPDAEILDTMPGPNGTVLGVTFRLLGQRFTALNGGPQFSFTPAVSFFVSCDTQEEIDRLWDNLVAGGAPQRCGWLTDRFGLSWQIVPAVLGDMLRDADRARAGRVFQAMMGMVKLDIPELQAAYAEP